MKKPISSNSSPACLSGLSATYIQTEDTAGRTETDFQDITIEAIDGGGGFYFVLKTERWAIDDAADLTNLLKDFDKRLKNK